MKGKRSKKPKIKTIYTDPYNLEEALKAVKAVKALKVVSMVQVKKPNVIENTVRVVKIDVEKSISEAGIAEHVRGLILRGLREEGFCPGVTFVYRDMGVVVKIERI